MENVMKLVFARVSHGNSMAPLQYKTEKEPSRQQWQVYIAVVWYPIGVSDRQPSIFKRLDVILGYSGQYRNMNFK
jgi:hypothetical protein